IIILIVSHWLLSCVYPFLFPRHVALPDLHSFPTRRSSDLLIAESVEIPDNRSYVIFNLREQARFQDGEPITAEDVEFSYRILTRSEEHTSELQSRENLVCRLLLEKKKTKAGACRRGWDDTR